MKMKDHNHDEENKVLNSIGTAFLVLLSRTKSIGAQSKIGRQGSFAQEGSQDHKYFHK